MKFKITKNKVITGLIIMCILAGAFWYGGGAPGLQGWKVGSKTKVNKGEDINLVNSDEIELPDSSLKDVAEEYKKEIENKNDEIVVIQEVEEIETVNNTEELRDEQDEKVAKDEPEKTPEKKKPGEEGKLSADEKVKLAQELSRTSSPAIEKGSEDYSESKGMKIDANTGKDKYLTDPVPEGKPIPVEPQVSKITDVEGTCTLSIRCDTILDNMNWLNPDKVELVPEDGVILATKTVKFYEGESVFNVLLREVKAAKIHMEFTNTPIYNSVYIEGINNLYEFDCGELSGWMYKVNDWFPNYGCSRYQVKEGDKIEWVYTCELGVDVGGFSAIGGE